MATPEELWGARSADAKAFADSLLRARINAGRPKRTETELIDIAEPVSTSTDEGVHTKFNQAENEEKGFWETPIVKGVLDALSVGTYTTAAAANAGVESIRHAQDKLDETGNPIAAAGEFIGTGIDQIVNHNPLVMGIKAAGGDRDSKRTFADVIKNFESSQVSEEFSNQADQKAVQGIAGFAGDVVLDPLNFVPGVAVAKVTGGAIKGGAMAAKAAKDIASGGEKLGRVGEGMGRIESRIAGAKAGAKQGLNEYRMDRAAEKAFKDAKSSINKGAPIADYSEAIPGFTHLPEDVLAGVRKPTAKDYKGAAAKARKAGKAKGKKSDPLIPTEPVHYGNFITPVGKVDEELKLPTEVIDLSPKIPETPIPADKTITRQILENPESLVPAFNHVDDPGKLNVLDHINDTPVDEWVKGTANLQADVMRLPKKTQVKIQEFIATKQAAGEKVMPSELRKLGFKGNTHEAMKAIRTAGQNLNQLTRKSGAFRDILRAYKADRLPVEDKARFEEFASNFFKLTGDDRLNKERIHELANDFLTQNSGAIVQSSLLHAPAAEPGRLSGLSMGLVNKTPQLAKDAPIRGLLSFLPPDSAIKYARPYRETERLGMAEHMVQKSEADILNGISPEFVGKLADDVLNEHFIEYSTPSGSFMTRGGWRTSTESLADGLPKKELFWTTHSSIDLFRKLNTKISEYMKNIPELDAVRNIRGNSKINEEAYQKAYRTIKDNLYMRALGHVDSNLKAHNIYGYLTNVMPEGGVAIRLSMYDVFEAMGPELRMKHLWTPKGDINNFRPSQVMNVAETMIRMISDASIDGTIDIAKARKNLQEILKGNYAKNADAAGITRLIEKNLDEYDQKFNQEILDAAKKNGVTNPEKSRNARYNSFIKGMLEKVDADGMTVLQKLADTTLRNTAMHASHYSSKIVFAKEEHVKRLTEALEYGTVGQFSHIVSGIVRPDRLEPEVSKVLKDEIRADNLKVVSPDELAVADEVQKVADITLEGKAVELFHRVEPTGKVGSFGIQAGPKPKVNPNRLNLSTKNAHEVMLNGKRILTDGKTVAQKWTTQRWVSKNADEFKAKVNTANAKVADRVQDTRLDPTKILDTVAQHSDEEIVNFARIELAHDTARKMFVGQQMFNVRFGKEISYDVVTSGMHLGTALETAFHGAVNEYARKYSPEDANRAFKELQSSEHDIHALVAEGKFDGMEPAVVDMAKLTSHVFDPSTNNFYVRNGIGPEHMNSILKNNNVNEAWRFPTMIDGELVTPAQMGQVWKTWTNIENPYKALAAIHTAMIKAASDVSMGARFSSRFGLDHIPVGEEGKWAKLGEFDKVDNAFLSLIDKNKFYPKEVIAEIPELGRFITASRTFKNEKFQQWVNSFDEFTSALKMTQTVMKPGHHVMSVMGDFFRNRLAGVTGTSSMKESWNIIRARNASSKELSELDNYAKIKDNSVALPYEAATQGKSAMNVIIGGKKIGIDHSTIYDMFTQRGIFLPPHQGGIAEDMLVHGHAPGLDNLDGGGIANAVSKTTSRINRGVSGLVNNKVIKLNDFTSQRDNLFRGEMAIHAMKSKNFKTIEEALDFAEAKVRKWAPTAKDLTAMESKYNRRVFLYYTWLRGMLPRVVEGIVARPTVATAPSKAMYNLAIANGLDPASIGDPFDPTVLMPDYYTNGVLGPQWQDPKSGHLWGFNPTSPVMDVFNSVGAGMSLSGMNPFQEESNGERIGRTLMGMTNPIFRSPIELSMGRNIATDTPILDQGQYLTDMVGPARVASKITGHTINPALGGLPRRTEAKFREGIEPSDWGNNAAIELANFMLGAQIKDFTSDSAVKSAEFDEKDREKQDQTNASRAEWWK